MMLPDQSGREENKGTCVRRPCRVYNLWPERTVLKSRDLRISYTPSDTCDIALYIQTFSNRPDFSVSAQSLPADFGFSHIRLGKNNGFWLGNVVVGDSDDGFMVKKDAPLGNMEQIARHQGEVDIGIMFPYGHTPSPLAVKITSDMLDVAIPF